MKTIKETLVKAEGLQALDPAGKEASRLIKQALTSLEKLEAVDVGELREVLKHDVVIKHDISIKDQRALRLRYKAAALLAEFLEGD